MECNYQTRYDCKVQIAGAFCFRAGDGGAVQACVGWDRDPRVLRHRSAVPGGGGLPPEGLAVHQPRDRRTLRLLPVVLVVSMRILTITSQM